MHFSYVSGLDPAHPCRVSLQSKAIAAGDLGAGSLAEAVKEATATRQRLTDATTAAEIARLEEQVS